MLLPVLRPLVSPEYILQGYCQAFSVPSCRDELLRLAMRPEAELRAAAEQCPGPNDHNYTTATAGGPCSVCGWIRRILENWQPVVVSTDRGGEYLCCRHPVFRAVHCR